MNIQTVADNLRFRIASKEKLLVEYTDMRDSLSKVTDAYQALYSHWNTNVTELEYNIGELNYILQEVEQDCCNNSGECAKGFNYVFHSSTPKCSLIAFPPSMSR